MIYFCCRKPKKIRFIRALNRLVIIGANLIILMMLAHVVLAEASSVTTVEAGSISLNPNQTGSVPVRVNGIPSGGDLGAYDLQISFNPNVIKVQDVRGGDPPFDNIMGENIDNNTGVVKFNAIGSPPYPTGSITIAYLKIIAVGNAGSSSPLAVTVTGLINSTGSDIPNTVVDGLVVIVTSKTQSSVSIFLDRNETQIGGTVTVSGRISPSYQASVPLTFTRPDGSQVLRIVSSRVDGSFTYVFTPDISGMWNVKASVAEDSNILGSESLTEPFNVTRLESTISMTLTPNVIKPSEEVLIEGSVNPLHANMTIKLEYRFREGEWNLITETSTNLTGGFRFLLSSVLVSQGIFIEVRASWDGDWNHAGATSPSAYVYIAELSTLSMYLSNNSTAINKTIVIRGQVLPIHIYVDVTVSVKSPNGTLTTQAIQTDAAGNYKIALVVDEVGTWNFNASWAGDTDTLGAESSLSELEVTTTGSSINLQTSASLILVGSDIVFSGKIEPQGIYPVTLTLTRPNSSLVFLETMSYIDGNYSFSFNPDQAGVWLVQASSSGNLSYGGSSSPENSFTVDKLTSSLSLSLVPPLPKKGDLLNLRGAIVPSTSRTEVNILVSNDEGRTWSLVSSPITGAEGEYSASWRAEQMGTYYFEAVWEGDGERSGCVSHVLILTIQEKILFTSIILPNGTESNVVVSTDASGVVLNVDQAEGKIDADLASSGRTEGIMNIFIQDSLLYSYGRTIKDLAFAADGIQIAPDTLKVTDGYLVTIQFNNNPKKVSVYYLTYFLSVVATNYQKEALTGANISLNGPVRLSSITNELGLADFPPIPKGNYTIQIYYGFKVGESSVSVNENKTLTFNTIAGKTEAEYAELQKDYGFLQIQYQSNVKFLNMMNFLMRLIATMIAFVAVIVYFIRLTRT